MTDTVYQASLFATAAHEAIGQRRKYTFEPYIEHPRRVARLIRFHGGGKDALATAWLHDVVEDTQVSLETINHHFGPVVAGYVDELTNVPASFGNRQQRFEANCERLAKASIIAQSVKLADIIDNVPSTVQHDPEFAALYVREKLTVLPLLSRAQHSLRNHAEAVLEAAQKVLA